CGLPPPRRGSSSSSTSSRRRRAGRSSSSRSRELRGRRGRSSSSKSSSVGMCGTLGGWKRGPGRSGLLGQVVFGVKGEPLVGQGGGGRLVVVDVDRQGRVSLRPYPDHQGVRVVDADLGR